MVATRGQGFAGARTAPSSGQGFCGQQSSLSRQRRIPLEESRSARFPLTFLSLEVPERPKVQEKGFSAIISWASSTWARLQISAPAEPAVRASIEFVGSVR